MRKTLLLIFLCFISLTILAQQPTPFVTAHNGCWEGTAIPKNSKEAIAMAKKLGYSAISIDTRQADNIKDLLKACKKYGIMPLVQGDQVATFKAVQKMMKNKWICQTSSDSIAQEVHTFSNCEILVNMDNVTPQEAIKRLKAIGRPCGLSATQPATLTKTLCVQLRAHGFETQSELFKPAYEVQATNFGVSRTLSDFSYPYNPTIKPTDIWAAVGQILSQKDELNKQWDHYAHGGLVLRFWFRGAIIVIVNGDKKYSLVSKGDSMQYISTRFTDTAPTIRIVAALDTELAEMEVTLYAVE